MNVDTKASPRYATGTAVQLGNEALMERLQAFGLIESNGEGGWLLTECCRAGLGGARGRYASVAENRAGRHSAVAGA